METWNEKIKEARRIKGWSQQKVADILGVTRACYSNYEQGIREPTIALLKSICERCKYRLTILLGLTTIIKLRFDYFFFRTFIKF